MNETRTGVTSKKSRVFEEGDLKVDILGKEYNIHPSEVPCSECGAKRGVECIAIRTDGRVTNYRPKGFFAHRERTMYDAMGAVASIKVALELFDDGVAGWVEVVSTVRNSLGRGHQLYADLTPTLGVAA
jgi:hypothetical protein